MNPNTYGARQTPRLQNTQKVGIPGGWGGSAAPAAAAPASMQNPFGGLSAAGRQNQLSGFAQVMGGGNGQGPIDMSDFPSLSGGPRAQQSSIGATGGWNSSTIRQPPSQLPPQQQSQPRAPSAAASQQSIEQYEAQRAAQPQNERSGGDDFPPLSGQLNGDGIGQSGPFDAGLGSPDLQSRQGSGQITQLPIRQNGPGFQSNSIGQMSQSQLPPANGHSSSAAGLKKYADMTENERWGLPGLLAALEARRQIESGGPVDETLPPMMRSCVIMGQDLNDLGMNLDSPEPLYPTFAAFPALSSSGSGFDFHDRHVVPDFTLPSAYTVTNVPPLSSRMAAFSDETLFSIFYQMPRDIAQELAAQELTAREWRWHKVLRQWLQKDTRDSNTGSSLPLIDLAAGALIGAQPVRVGERSERGVYIFFDAMNWRRERREFVLDYEQLDHHRSPPAATPGAVGGAGAGMGVGAGLQNGAIGAPQQA